MDNILSDHLVEKHKIRFWLYMKDLHNYKNFFYLFLQNNKLEFE